MNHSSLFSTRSILAATGLGIFSLLSSSAASAAVIHFNSSTDLTNHFVENGTPGSGNAWRYTSSAGPDGGSGSIYGNNAGWLTYQEAFSPTTASLSSGIYFQYRNPDWSSSTLSLVFGVTSQENYAPNVTLSGGAGQTHYAGLLHLVRQTSPVSYRIDLRSQAVNNGTKVTDSVSASGVSLTHQAWYYLGLESTFNSVDQTYSLTVKLYSTNPDASLDSELLTTSIENFSLPGLSDAENSYIFFGVNGGSASGKGVQFLDRFTVIPEPSTTAVLGLGFVVALFYGSKVRSGKLNR